MKYSRWKEILPMEIGHSMNRTMMYQRISIKEMKGGNPRTGERNPYSRAEREVVQGGSWLVAALAVNRSW
jgi:hypothetical protein